MCCLSLATLAAAPARAQETLDGAISTNERLASNGNEPIARLNLGILHAARGIDFFEADQLDEAISSFRTSLQWNPYSRDIRYNLSQALYIRAAQLKERGTPAGELAPLHGEILKEAMTVRGLDPVNSNLLKILGYTYRNLGDESRAAAVLAESAELPFDIHDVRMEVGASETRVTGVLRNLTLAGGDPVKLRVTLFGLSGEARGASDIQVPVPQVNQGASFEARIRTAARSRGDNDVAGWKYEVIGRK